MKKNMKILMLSASMFVMTLVPSTLKADDFSGQESYYIDFCSRPLPTQTGVLREKPARKSP